MNNRLLFLLLITLTLALPAAAQRRQQPDRSLSQTRDSRALMKAYDRAEAATIAFRAAMAAGNQGAFQDALKQARVIAVFPAHLQINSLVGGTRTGLVCMRDRQTSEWQPPIFVAITSSSDNRLKGDDSDLILLGSSDRAAQLFFNDRFTLHQLSGFNKAPINSAVPHDDTAGIENELHVFRHTGEQVLPISLAEVSIEHDNEVNQAVYGVQRVQQFLPVSNWIPRRVLVFPDTLNEYTLDVQGS